MLIGCVQVDILWPSQGAAQLRDARARKDAIAREEALKALESITASAQAIFGDDVIVETDLITASWDEFADQTASDPFVATYRVRAYPDGEPLSAYVLDLEVNGDNSGSGSLAVWGEPMDLATQELGGFAVLDPMRRVAMLRYLSSLNAPPDSDLWFDTLDYKWIDGLGLEIEWAVALMGDCERLGYAPRDCAIAAWSPSNDVNDEVYKLSWFDHDAGEWRQIGEFVGDPRNGGFRLDKGLGSNPPN